MRKHNPKTLDGKAKLLLRRVKESIIVVPDRTKYKSDGEQNIPGAMSENPFG